MDESTIPTIQRQLERMRVTASDPERLVHVIVGAHGELLDVRLDRRVGGRGELLQEPDLLYGGESLPLRFRDRASAGHECARLIRQAEAAIASRGAGGPAQPKRPADLTVADAPDAYAPPELLEQDRIGRVREQAVA